MFRFLIYIPNRGVVRSVVKKGGAAMNLGQISEENEQFVNEYKKYGYSTKTQLANDAFKLLRQVKAKELREAWRRSAFLELTGVPQEKVWEELDGEDFDQSR